MITVDMTRKELQIAIRLLVELEQAEISYRMAGYPFRDTEKKVQYEEIVQRLTEQRAKVAELESILRGYTR